MKTYQIIEPPFVAPVDLQTLNTAYNNLQTRHDEAIKATSELKTAVANLDLNEAEESFRNKLISDIEYTIDSNTAYGNSASAYDNIMKLSGDIASDTALIGRLKAQQAYTAYKNQVDSMDMPEDYKEYFKEMNPYYYEDKFDKDGNVIGGSTWNPIKTPTTVVNLADIVDKGIRRVAEESGQTVVTRWLDKDGKITTDPTKAFDGEVYDVTTNTYSRLGHDKIVKSIMAVIEETPGAKESLDQDYEVAVWKHKKNSTDALTVSDVTDENGKILGPTEYLAKRINDAAATAAYNKSVTQTTYGRGLATYNKAKQDKSEGDILASLYSPQLSASGVGTPVSVEINVGAESLQTKNQIFGTIRDDLNQLYPNISIANNYESLKDAVNSIPVTDENRSLINLYNTYLDLYREADLNLSNITEQMSSEDKKNYEFALRMLSGGELIKDGSKYDNQAINYINNIYGEGDYISIDFDNETLKNDFITRLLGNNNTLESLGINEKGNSIIVPRSASNVLPLIADISNDVKEDANLGFWKTIGGYFNNRYNISSYDKNGNKVVHSEPYTSGTEILNARFQNLAGIYNKANDINEKYTDKYNVNPSTIEVSVELLPGESFNHTYLYDMYKKGLIKGVDYEKHAKYFNETIKSAAMGDYSQKLMYRSENGTPMTIIKEGNKRFEFGEEIKSALDEDRATMIPAHASGIYDPITKSLGGYYFQIFPTKEQKKKNDKNDVITYYIPGLGSEVGKDIMLQDPQVLINDVNTKLIETKSSRFLTTGRETPIIGDIIIEGLGYGNAVLTFQGMTKVIDKQDVNAISKAVMDFNSIKKAIDNRPVNISPIDYANKMGAGPVLDECAKTISLVTGNDLKLIERMLNRQLVL